MQLSQKQNTFPQFFPEFSKSKLSFNCFGKEDDPKTQPDKCLKIPVSEDTSKNNMVNVHKHC